MPKTSETANNSSTKAEFKLITKKGSGFPGTKEDFSLTYFSDKEGKTSVDPKLNTTIDSYDQAKGTGEATITAVKNQSVPGDYFIKLNSTKSKLNIPLSPLSVKKPISGLDKIKYLNLTSDHAILKKPTTDSKMDLLGTLKSSKHDGFFQRTKKLGYYITEYNKYDDYLDFNELKESEYDQATGLLKLDIPVGSRVLANFNDNIKEHIINYPIIFVELDPKEKPGNNVKDFLINHSILSEPVDKDGDLKYIAMLTLSDGSV